jgi:uncharacterized protein YkwD
LLLEIGLRQFATSADCATISPMRVQRLASMRALLFLLLALVVLGLVSDLVHAQNAAGDLLALINNARRNEGLQPYVVSARLNGAAQRHSDDMASTGRIDHTGSDGSSSTQRVLQAGYGAYEFGLVASENIYGGTGGPELPFNEWMGEPGARSNLLSEKYREVGIGVAGDAQGRTFWTLTVGAQPNVLPVLINDGATSVDTISVTLKLVPERIAPEGRGTAIGQPVEYRASTSRAFPDAEWSSWVEKVSFGLDDMPGEQTVYVQLRDADGRTIISQASVTLTGEDVTLTPTEAVGTETPATATATQTATATLTLTPRTSPTSTETATPTATETAAPSPTVAVSATPQPTLPVEPRDQTPSAMASAAVTDTPVAPDIPTSTPPLPTTATSLPATISLPEVAVTARTPSWPEPGEEEAGVEADPLALASRLAPWALGLQIVALVLGVYVALRRPSE